MTGGRFRSALPSERLAHHHSRLINVPSQRGGGNFRCISSEALQVRCPSSNRNMSSICEHHCQTLNSRQQQSIWILSLDDRRAIGSPICFNLDLEPCRSSQSMKQARTYRRRAGFWQASSTLARHVGARIDTSFGEFTGQSQI